MPSPPRNIRCVNSSVMKGASFPHFADEDKDEDKEKKRNIFFFFGV